MVQQIELALDTFGDIQAGADGKVLTHAQVIRNVIEESVLADEVGVDCIGLGEHHRPDFAISSPEVLLGAIASRTRRIHLASSVTVLSSDDPIRVFFGCVSHLKRQILTIRVEKFDSYLFAMRAMARTASRFWSAALV